MESDAPRRRGVICGLRAAPPTDHAQTPARQRSLDLVCDVPVFSTPFLGSRRCRRAHRCRLTPPSMPRGKARAMLHTLRSFS